MKKKRRGVVEQTRKSINFSFILTVKLKFTNLTNLTELSVIAFSSSSPSLFEISIYIFFFLLKRRNTKANETYTERKTKKKKAKENK